MISGTDMAMARAAAESLMTSTCTITRLGAPVTDPDSGKVTRPSTPIYAGMCRVKPPRSRSRGRTAHIAGVEIDPELFQVSVPFAVTGIRVNDQVFIDTSPDPDLPGRKFYVRFTPALGDAISARRLECEER